MKIEKIVVQQTVKCRKETRRGGEEDQPPSKQRSGECYSCAFVSCYLWHVFRLQDMRPCIVGLVSSTGMTVLFKVDILDI